ncbi:MAG: XisH family protein [Anaerolineae bacterium]|nr:XisH family protein [Anaerolineae bacterium]
MPAKDRYHLEVVHALRQAGWQVSDKPLNIRIGERDLYPDILAWYEDGRQIVVEIKVFDSDYSAVHHLMEAAGQYSVYRAAIKKLGLNLPIYLAVSLEAYEGILTEPLGQLVISSLEIKLLLIDVELAEVVEWKN